jgi:outer membrane protein assembly factor BamB
MVSFSRPSRWPRWARFLVSALAVVAVLAATGVVGYRVLAPADTVVPAAQPYPERAVATSQRYGELTSAPLIVDGRLRVYADPRRVWADAQVTSRTEQTPYWTFRRWPAQVAGVVSLEGKFEGVALVIVKFSDGVVVALNPRTGRVAWQAETKAGDQDTFAGRRTGAATVYEPAGLFTTRSAKDGAAVLVVAGGDEAIGFDPWSGERLWYQAFPEHPGCHETDWTGETTYVVKDSCVAPAELTVYDAATGMRLGQWKPPDALAGPAEEANWFVQPVSCFRGHSRCGLIRAAPAAEVVTAVENFRNPGTGTLASVWRLNGDGTVEAEKNAQGETPFLLSGSLIQTEVSGIVQSKERDTGDVLWRSAFAVDRVVAVDLNGVYAITPDLRFVVLHPATGVELSRTDLRQVPNEQWKIGHVHVAGRFVAVERITGAKETAPDERYYTGPTPVVMAGV